MKNTKKGFTLVELLVVIAILAILATVSVVGYTSFINRAEESNAQTEAHQIKAVIESALIGVDYVVVSDTANNIIIAYEEDGKVVFTADVSDVEGTDYDDISDDLTEYASKLTVTTEGGLNYEYSDDVTIDVMTGKVVNE